MRCSSDEAARGRDGMTVDPSAPEDVAPAIAAGVTEHDAQDPTVPEASPTSTLVLLVPHNPPKSVDFSALSLHTVRPHSLSHTNLIALSLPLPPVSLSLRSPPPTATRDVFVVQNCRVAQVLSNNGHIISSSRIFRQ